MAQASGGIFAPLAFLKGLILVFALGIVGLSAAPQVAQAGVWEDLWQTPAQQAQSTFNAGNFTPAACLATASEARGAALYRNADFASAAAKLGANDYNRGSALAKAGNFEEALAAYNARLAVTPEDADVLFNREIVAKLLQRQQDGHDQNQQSQGQDQSHQSPSGQDELLGQWGKQEDVATPRDQAQDQQGDIKPSDAQGVQSDGQPQNQAGEGQ